MKCSSVPRLYSVVSFILVALLGFTISGCAQRQIPVNYNQLPQVPIQALSADKALIYLYSPDGIDMPIRIDGKPYGELEGRVYTYFYLEPGNHSIVYYDWLLPKSKLAEINAKFEGGHVYHLKQFHETQRTEGGALVQGLVAGLGFSSNAMSRFGEISADEASYLRKKLTLLTTEEDL
ncbi:hypothetical protein BTA51_28240 [Hahella sp. CCB-MM4]|uniref:DUF2846 domain-containing protein n=1 Tax=Hahella sp. (strain CCB-MM4) TaxID=1926491 RepID=UPI000B9A1A3C|nr:DUF2846 domain-containing protein [Hahella sp. CCB-MM4]OZG70020.1 hypothetical protein BTA51_28240 [Hahella sp. CCB-MM4]